MNIIHERRARRASDVLRRPLKITGLTKFLGVLLILASLSQTVQAGQSVTLAWNRCTNSTVAGYNIYYGGASRAYTNEISAGNTTNATISGLVPGTTYYFAATTYSAAGLESPFSSEVSYLVPLLNAPIVNYSNTYTAVVITNAPGFYTNRLHQIKPIPLLSTNVIFNGFWIYPPSGTWILQSSSNLLTWVDYATATNAVFVPNNGGNWFFRFKSP
jgi:hypothetical protein